MRGRGEAPQRIVIVDALDVTRVQPARDRKAQLHLPQTLIDLRHLAGLIPGVGHQLFLLLLNHARAERRNHTLARIEIQLVEPTCARLRSADLVTAGILAAVDRRPEHRLGVRVESRSRRPTFTIDCSFLLPRLRRIIGKGRARRFLPAAARLPA